VLAQLARYECLTLLRDPLLDFRQLGLARRSLEHLVSPGINLKFPLMLADGLLSISIAECGKAVGGHQQRDHGRER
jgi:hypothetical protein